MQVLVDLFTLNIQFFMMVLLGAFGGCLIQKLYQKKKLAPKEIIPHTTVKTAKASNHSGLTRWKSKILDIVGFWITPASTNSINANPMNANPKMSRCTYKFFSLSSMTSQGQDMQCIFEEGHYGEHRYRELFPPPQTPPMQGWIKMENTKVTDGISKENES